MGWMQPLVHLQKKRGRNSFSEKSFDERATENNTSNTDQEKYSQSQGGGEQWVPSVGTCAHTTAAGHLPLTADALPSRVIR